MEDLRPYAPFGAAILVGLLSFAAGDYALLVRMVAVAIACGGVVWLETRWGIVATSVFGLGACGYLFWRKLDAAGPSLCETNSVQNCDLVNASAASELFGVPVSLLGAGYFLGLAGAALLAAEPPQRTSVFRVTALTAAAGCVFAVYLWTQMLALGTMCPMCYGIYMSCGLLLWAGLRGLGQSGVSLFDDLGALPTSSTAVTVAGTFLVVVFLGYSTYTSASDEVARPVDIDEPDDVDRRSTFYAPPAGVVGLAGDEPVLGDPDAPYMVLEYADFGCPHCATTGTALKQLVAQHPEIQVRFRPFALSGACNPALERSDVGLERCRAAMAGECATQQDRFWEYSSLVFANQRDLSDTALEAAAEQAGLDLEQWRTCMKDRNTVAEVVEDAEAGFKAGVRGTPTLFLRGVTDDGAWLDVCAGPEAVLLLTQLHQDGQRLPKPKFSSCAEAH